MHACVRAHIPHTYTHTHTHAHTAPTCKHLRVPWARRYPVIVRAAFSLGGLGSGQPSCCDAWRRVCLCVWLARPPVFSRFDGSPVCSVACVWHGASRFTRPSQRYAYRRRAGFAYNQAEMRDLVTRALTASPQVLVEKSMKGCVRYAAVPLCCAVVLRCCAAVVLS